MNIFFRHLFRVAVASSSPTFVSIVLYARVICAWFLPLGPVVASPWDWSPWDASNLSVYILNLFFHVFLKAFWIFFPPIFFFFNFYYFFKSWTVHCGAASRTFGSSGQLRSLPWTSVGRCGRLSMSFGI